VADHSDGWTPRRIDLPSVPNLREVGGARAAGARRVRGNMLFRSTQLSDVSDEDVQALSALNLSAVVDLRTEVEVIRAPDVRVTASYVWLDVLRDFEPASSLGIEEVFTDPLRFEGILRDGTAAGLMRQAYLAMVDLPSARESYARWLVGLAEGSGPVLVHCTNGKDRTGWAVALVLLAVGVDLEDVMTDYLTTNQQLLPALDGMFRSVGQRMDPELLLPVLGVQEDYLLAALEQVRRAGGLDTYLEGLGVTDAQRADLSDRLTEPADRVVAAD
jgi:protein-tyrosine phosphatase